MKVGVSSSCFCQPDSKRTLLDPNQNYSKHTSAVTFGSMFRSLLLTFWYDWLPRTSAVNVVESRIRPNCLEIIFCSCECLSLHPTSYHCHSPTGMSRGPELSLSFAGSSWCTAWRTLAVLGENRSGGDGGGFVKALQSPAWDLLPGLERLLCLLSLNKHSFLQYLVRSLSFDVPTA